MGGCIAKIEPNRVSFIYDLLIVVLWIIVALLVNLSEVVPKKACINYLAPCKFFLTNTYTSLHIAYSQP